MSTQRPLRLAPIEGLLSYVAAVRGFSRNAALFLTVTAFRGIVIFALQTVLNLYLYSLGYDTRFIGLINGVNSLAVLFVSLPLGYLADRFGTRIILLGGGIAYPLSILGLSLVHGTPAIMVFNFLFGAVAATYWVAGMPLLFASTSERERVHAFSINSFLLWGVGPLGALVSGQVVEIAARILGVSSSSSSALRFGLFFMAFVALVGAIPYPWLREPARRSREEAPPPPRGELARLMVQLLTPDLILAFGVGALLTFIQLYFHLRFGLAPGAVGVVMAVGGVISGVGTLMTPIASRRWGNLRSTVALQWAVVVPMIAVALATHLFIAVPAYWLLVTLRGMSDPVYNAFVQERVPSAYRARLTGFYSVTYSIGFSLGPVAGGEVQKLHGFTPAFLMAACVYVLGPTLLFVFFGRRSSE